jgi:hypothetical protein
MRHTAIAIVACLALTATSVWAAETLGPGESTTIDSEHCSLAVTNDTIHQVTVACGPAYEQIAGVDVCIDHDWQTWHSVVRRDEAGAIVCTYGHEHGDDPHDLDASFGPPNSWWGGTQSISYPWHTPMENEMKHWFYKYLVRTNLQPLPDLQLTQFRSLYVRNLRAVGHLEGLSALLDNGMQAGFPNPNHSFSFEAEVCKDGGRCGTVQIGGWQHYGHGTLSNGANGTYCVLACDVVPGVDNSLRRSHGDPSSYRRDFTWYGANGGEAASPGQVRIGVGLGTIGEATGYVDPVNYAALHQYPPQTSGTSGPVVNAFNGSWYSLEITSVSVPVALDARDGAADGYVTWSGYVSRWGVVRNEGACLGEDGQPSYGVDCVPVKIVDAPVGTVQYRDSTHNAAYGTRYGSAQDHDVMVTYGTAPNGQPNRASLIRFPN